MSTFGNILYTKNEFEEYLKQIEKKESILINYIVKDKLGNPYRYGEEGDKEESQSKKICLKNGYEVKIRIWGTSSNFEIGDCEKIFRTYWNDEYTDKTTGFPTTEQTKLLEKCNSTLKHYKMHNRKVALIMIDLDHFKEVNDRNNHSVGSNVLREFSELLFNVFYACAIMIHQTGDEFNVLFPYTDELELVEMVKKLKEARDEIKNHQFKDAEGIELSMAVGVKCIEEENLDFMSARNMAEKAYNSSGKNSSKQRDSIRVERKLKQVEDSWASTDLRMAWTRLICNLDRMISGNIYLEYIRKYSEESSDIKRFQSEIENIIEWINPSWNEFNIKYSSKNMLLDTREQFSKLEVGLAIAQGLLKNPKYMEKEIIFKVEDKKIEICIDSKTVIEYENDNNPAEKFEGKCIEYYRKNSSQRCKRIVLVFAGYEDSFMPEDIFYKVIRVDTRPTTGGGLPDFWAATLCELITIMEENSGVSDIMIYGNLECIENIIELFDSINNWETDKKYNLKYISQKTFKSIEDIRGFKEKFQDKIWKCRQAELCNKIYQIYESEFVENTDKSITKKIQKRRILKRNLSYDEIALKIQDGCRVETLADAYPTVLEILRQQKNDIRYNIKDQAGRDLLELTDFKIILSSPDSKDLPDYYTEDKEVLEEYYDKILGKESSLFRKELLKNNQLKALIKHVVQAVKGENSYATRRAILVVPNEVKDEDNFSPLGLISIWVAPRFIDEHLELEFSYNWRTVEAVVGLPLSMYASVKFAEELTDLIRTEVKSYDYSVSMGKVSYIAHSLHMFLDSESMNIVRGIINDASI